MNKQLKLIILLLLLWVTHAPATAATCSMSTTPTVAFGAYTSPGGSLIDSNGTVTVLCVPDLLSFNCAQSYTLSLSMGSALSFTRKMSSGANLLAYNLYSNAGHTTIWGDGTSGTATVSDTINTSILGILCLSGSKNATIYGRIPGNQNVPVGNYSDTITLTITY